MCSWRALPHFVDASCLFFKWILKSQKEQTRNCVCCTVLQNQSTWSIINPWHLCKTTKKTQEMTDKCSYIYIYMVFWKHTTKVTLTETSRSTGNNLGEFRPFNNPLNNKYMKSPLWVGGQEICLQPATLWCDVTSRHFSFTLNCDNHSSAYRCLQTCKSWAWLLTLHYFL